MKILLLFFYYFLILFSIIGYGNLSSKILNKKFSFSELGFFGLIFVILISYITNFFVPHGYIHNIVIISIGIISFLLFLLKSKFDNFYFKLTLIVFSILFIGILLYKNHDDFFYYHFPYTLSIIEQKKIIGIGHLEHGFRTPSSIFYLNSLFYLPFIKLSLINMGAIFYMGFSNIFFLEKIFSILERKKINFLLFLSLASLLLINTAFYRIAEHGTDRSALILIFVLVVVYYESLKYIDFSDRQKLIKSYESILVLLLLIISLKSFYLIYIILLMTWLIQFKSILFKNHLLKDLFKNKVTYFFIFSIIIFILTVFLNTGCLIYPASFTCFSSVEWSIPLEQVSSMKNWYSLWAKAGANPNFRTLDPELYLNNFNWVLNWVNTYFFTKMSDFLAVVLFISLICFFSLKNQKKKILKKDNYKLLYISIFFLFIEWFLNHPSLRYGGYSVVALLILIPLSIYISSYSIYNKKLKKIIIFLILISFGVFVIKNVKRIHQEMVKYNYNPFKNPNYFIKDNAFFFSDTIKSYDDIRNKYDKRFYLILSVPFINSNN